MVEPVFDFLPKWRDNAKFCQKMTPKWGILPIFLFFRTPVPGIFAPFLAFPKSRSFRYIGKEKLSDNFDFQPFFPLYRGKREKSITCYECNTHFFLVWHHDIIALRQKSREQTDRHFGDRPFFGGSVFPFLFPVGKEIHMNRTKTDTRKQDRIRIRVTREEKEALRRHCSSLGYDMSGYVRALIERDVKEGIVCRR